MSIPLGDLASTASSTTSGTKSSKRTKQKKWDPIALPLEPEELEQAPPEVLCKLHLPPGSLIRFFPHDMRHMYTAPSQSILLTRGVLDYIREYNQVGPAKSKGKLFLCSMYEKTDSCDNSFVCREVHCTLKAGSARMRAPPAPSQLPRSSSTITITTNVAAAAAAAAGVLESPDDGADRRTGGGAAAVLGQAFHSGVVHTSPASPCGPTSLGATNSSAGAVGESNEELADADLVLTYTDVHMSSAPEAAHPRHEPGVMFRLALPNMQAPVDEIPSDKIFVTKGSKMYFDQVSRGETPTMNMQHCAHFLKNGLCCFGAECQFVHVVLQARRELLHEHGSHNDSGSERGDFGSSSVRSRSSSMGSSMSSEGSLGLGKKHRTSKRAKETPLSMTDATDVPFGRLPPNAPPQVLYASALPLPPQQQQQVGVTVPTSSSNTATSLPVTTNVFPTAAPFGAPQGFFPTAGGIPTTLGGLATPQYHTQQSFVPVMPTMTPTGGAQQPLSTTAYMQMSYPQNSATSLPAAHQQHQQQQQVASLTFMPTAGAFSGGNAQQVVFAQSAQGGVANWFPVAASSPQQQAQQQPVYIFFPQGAAVQPSPPGPGTAGAGPQQLYFVPQQPQTVMHPQPQQLMQAPPMHTAAFVGGGPPPPPPLQNTVAHQQLTQQQLFLLQQQMQLRQQQHQQR